MNSEDFVPPLAANMSAAFKTGGGRAFNTTGGRTVGITGEPPKRVSIIEWDSVEQAQAFLNSTAYKSLAPQQEKAIRFTRAYIVEATQ